MNPMRIVSWLMSLLRGTDGSASSRPIQERGNPLLMLALLLWNNNKNSKKSKARSRALRNCRQECEQVPEPIPERTPSPPRLHVIREESPRLPSVPSVTGTEDSHLTTNYNMQIRRQKTPRSASKQSVSGSPSVPQTAESYCRCKETPSLPSIPPVPGTPPVRNRDDESFCRCDESRCSTAESFCRCDESSGLRLLPSVSESTESFCHCDESPRLASIPKTAESFCRCDESPRLSTVPITPGTAKSSSRCNMLLYRRKSRLPTDVTDAQSIYHYNMTEEYAFHGNVDDHVSNSNLTHDFGASDDLTDHDFYNHNKSKCYLCGGPLSKKNRRKTDESLETARKDNMSQANDLLRLRSTSAQTFCVAQMQTRAQVPSMFKRRSNGSSKPKKNKRLQKAYRSPKKAQRNKRN